MATKTEVKGKSSEAVAKDEAVLKEKKKALKEKEKDLTAQKKELLKEKRKLVREKSKSLAAEFRDFLSRGSVIELAIGVVIGTAFKDVVTSLVEDIINPLIGVMTGQVDFASLYFNLSKTDYASLAEAEAAGAPIIKYGNFLSTMIDFVIVAFVIFIVIKYLSKVYGKPIEIKK